MTLEEMLAFKGGDLTAYEEAIEKRNKLNKALNRLSAKRDFLEDAVDLLEGDERQAQKRKELEAVNKKMTAKSLELDTLTRFISDNQR